MRVVAIAASTGGPRALGEIIPHLPENLGAAVMIVQHMPREFTRTLSQRLNSVSALGVSEAEDGEALRENHVYIAPGGYHMRVAGDAGNATVQLDTSATIWGVRPAADPLFASVAQSFGASAIGVILTGWDAMGRRVQQIRWAGGMGVVQDRDSSISTECHRPLSRSLGRIELRSAGHAACHRIWQSKVVGTLADEQRPGIV